MVEICLNCNGTGTVNLCNNQGGDFTIIGYQPTECTSCYGTGVISTDDDRYKNSLELKMVIKSHLSEIKDDKVEE